MANPASYVHAVYANDAIREEYSAFARTYGVNEAKMTRKLKKRVVHNVDPGTLQDKFTDGDPVPQPYGGTYDRYTTFDSRERREYHLQSEIDGVSIADETRRSQTYGKNEWTRDLRHLRVLHNTKHEKLIFGTTGQGTINKATLATRLRAQHTGGVKGTATTPGKSASLSALLKTHVSVGATGAVGGWNSTQRAHAAPTAGTIRPLTQKMFTDFVAEMWDDSSGGGEMIDVVCNYDLREKMSSFSGIGTFEQTMSATSKTPPTIQTSRQGINTETGMYTFEINRYAAPNTLYCLRRNAFEFLMMWWNRMVYLPKLGNSMEVSLNSIRTLAMREHEASSGIILAVS